MNELKECTRSCLMHFSAHYQLPPELDGLLSALNRARVVAIKMSPKQPKIEHAETLAKLLSEAFSLAQRFHGVRVCNDVYARVSRVKRHLAPGARMAGALVRAVEETVSNSEDESDNESESVTESESDSRESSSKDEEDSIEESDAEDPSFAKSCEIQCIAPEMAKHDTPVTCNGSKITVELPFLIQSVKKIVQHPDSSCARNPEACNADMRGELGQLFLKMSQEEEDKLYESLLTSSKVKSTRKAHTNAFKRRKSQIHSQIKANFTKCSKTLTASNISSLMGNLVKTVKSLSTTNRATVNTSISQSHTVVTMKSQQSKLVQPTMCTEKLAEDLNTSLSSVSYEHSKSMCHISEQLSRSSMDTSVFSSAVPKNGEDLKDGSVKFILCYSPLTAALEQREKNCQTLVSQRLIQSSCTGREEAVEDKKIVNPIKESRLTSVVKDDDTVQYYAKVFAEKMQQNITNQLNTSSHTPSVEQKEPLKNKRMPTPIKESRLTTVVEEKVVVQYYATMFAEKMKNTLSNQLKSGQHGRVILNAKRTKKAVSVKTNYSLSSVNIAKTSRLAHTMTNDILCSGHKLSLGSRANGFKTMSVETATSHILRKVIIEIQTIIIDQDVCLLLYYN